MFFIFVRKQVLVLHWVGFIRNGFKLALFGKGPVDIRKELVLFNVFNAYAEVGL